MKYSLKTKIIFPTLFIFSIGIIATIWLSFAYAKTSFYNMANSQILLLNTIFKEQVANWLKDICEDVEELSRHPDVIESLNSGKPTANDLLKSIKSNSELIQSAVVDLTGKTIATSNEGNLGTFYGDRDYFSEAISGKLSISEVLKSRVSGKPVIVVAAPVFEKDNIKGIVFETVDLGHFTDLFITCLKIGESGYAYITESDGTVVAHPDNSKILKEKINNIPNTVLFSQSVLENTGWKIIVRVDSYEILRPIIKIKMKNIITSGVIIFLIYFIIWIIIRYSVKNLIAIYSGIIKISEHLLNTSEKISKSAYQIATGSNEQAAASEKNSSSLEQISSMSKSNADNANHANHLINETRHIIEKAQDSMITLAEAMKEVSVSSRNTSEIIKVIDEIAFQTNLLSLNATVEAARAGESGAGFSVVAEEVRNLASRVAEAARKTTALIDKTVGTVDVVIERAKKADNDFKSVSDSTDEVVSVINEISKGSAEQDRGIEDTKISSSEMDKVIQENIVNAEEFTSIAEEMKLQSEQLIFYMSELTELIGGTQSNQSFNRTSGASARKLAPAPDAG